MATFSSMLKNMIEDVSDPSSVVPLPNVTAEILDMVIEYCQRHAESKDSNNNKDEELKAFDAEFVNVDQETLFGLILAANYLDIKGLLDLTCQAVAGMIKDKSPEEVREFFNIENDYTPEEEEHVRKESAWAFE